MIPPTNLLAMRAAANAPKRKAQGGALRLMGKQQSSGRIMGRGQSSVIATADRQLAAARKRLDGMPGAVKKGYERGGRTPQGFAKGGKIKTKITIPGDLTQAYRGYLIKHNTMNDTFHIQRDGQHISSPPSIEEAKKQIDEIAVD